MGECGGEVGRKRNIIAKGQEQAVGELEISAEGRRRTDWRHGRGEIEADEDMDARKRRDAQTVIVGDDKFLGGKSM